MMDRVSYNEIKTWCLESLYDGCKEFGRSHEWSYNQIIAYVYDNFCYKGESYKGILNKPKGSFDHAIEYLMVEVVILILGGGWDATQEEYHRNEIVKILQDNDLEFMLSMLENEERTEFEMDLCAMRLPGVCNQ